MIMYKQTEGEASNRALGAQARTIISVTTLVELTGAHAFKVLIAAKLHTLTGPTIVQTDTAADAKFVDTTSTNCIELPVGYVFQADEPITGIQLHAGAIEVL